jgi:hypothetical protein
VTELKTGGRYRSQVCDTEFIVVRPLPGDIDLTCGGHPVIDIKAEPDPGGVLQTGADGGSQLGKRYTDLSGRLEVLVTKAGNGSLALEGEPLALKDAKPLPASD